MSIPLIDLHIKNVVDFTIKTVLSDPDTHLRDIFGDARLEPHAALYGDRMISEVKNWITKTQIPVVMGYELDSAQIPGVTVSLAQNSPYKTYMGDVGLTFATPLQPYERDIIVPKFSPSSVEPSADGTYIKFTLPSSLPEEKAQLVLPGLVIRDKNGKEYGIGEEAGKPTAVSYGMALLRDADLSEIEIISPVAEATYRQGAMTYQESVVVAIYGHSNRNEGLWLWAIVMWGLLKFRPLLISTFGLDLSEPSSSDYIKADEFLGENVWRRFVSLGTKATYSWTSARQKDLVGLLLNIKASQSSDNGVEPQTVDLS